MAVPSMSTFLVWCLLPQDRASPLQSFRLSFDCPEARLSSSCLTVHVVPCLWIAISWPAISRRWAAAAIRDVSVRWAYNSYYELCSKEWRRSPADHSFLTRVTK